MDRSAEGPWRRRYDITRAGRAMLDLLTCEMSGTHDLIAEFLERYREDLVTQVNRDWNGPRVPHKRVDWPLPRNGRRPVCRYRIAPPRRLKGLRKA